MTTPFLVPSLPFLNLSIATGYGQLNLTEQATTMRTLPLPILLPAATAGA